MSTKGRRRKKSATGLAVSAKELGDYLEGITARRVQQLAAEGVLPKVGRGKYPLKACVLAYLQHVHGQHAKELAEVRQKQAPDSPAKQRLESAQARMAEIKVARLQGELMTVQQFERCLGDAYSRVRAQMMNLGPRLAPDVIDRPLEEAVEVIDDMMRDILEALHRADDVPDEAA